MTTTHRPELELPAAQRGAEPQRSAESQLVRGASLFVGSGGIFYAAVTGPTAFAQTRLAAPWWTPVAFLLIFVPTVSIVVLAFRWQLDRVRWAVLVFAAGYAIAAVSWLVVRTGETVPTEKALWLVWMPGLPALAMCLFWRFVPFGYLVFVCVVTRLSAFLSQAPGSRNPFVPELLFAVGYSALPCAACVVLVQVGRMLDKTSSTALTKATAVAAAAATRFERRRFDALTHDGVIATLLEASRTANSAVLADNARTTLRHLDRLRSGLPEQDFLEFDLVLASIRTAMTEVDDTVPLEISRADGTELTVPSEVVAALVAAMAEALRNWKRHAGSATREAQCTVAVDVDATTLRIVVVDDGVGFDPKTVPPDRLGLRASITARLSGLPGAWSTIASAPGRGTRVTVGWAVT